MKPCALLAMAACLACACSPELPAGYQLNCVQDSDCPEGTSCSRLCCVAPGETPACLAASWKNSAGGPCTKDEGCPSGLTCFTEALAGPVGGLCTRACGDSGCPNAEQCVPVPALASAAAYSSDELCMPQCSNGNPGSCRPGFRCGCVNDVCACLPACNPSGDGSCDADPESGRARICDATSGLCVDPP